MQAEKRRFNVDLDLEGFNLIVPCGLVGEPDEVIVQSAREMNAGLVVVGNSARSGLAAVMRGNTVEKVLDKLACDVLSLP